MSTIVALSTPPGRGGVSIIRLSGSLVVSIIKQILGKNLQARVATLAELTTAKGELIDKGLFIYFHEGASFTGEHILEFHGHGGSMVVDRALSRFLELGACLAEPGEFSKRAFLNGKLNLLEVEAIADLIDASSKQAAISAARTLRGEFAKEIDQLVSGVLDLRVMIEAMIDFSDQNLQFSEQSEIADRFHILIHKIEQLLSKSKQGCLLKDGLYLAIIGAPNVGKSSLLNALSGYESAIVTPVAGTTRDLIREHIVLDGLPVHLVDTAGIQLTDDPVEKIGIERAKNAMKEADGVLWVFDASNKNATQFPSTDVLDRGWCLCVGNKIDLLKNREEIENFSRNHEHKTVFISAKTGEGVEGLIKTICKEQGYEPDAQGVWIARRRHIEALKVAKEAMALAYQAVKESWGIELVAEHLYQGQQSLLSIIGKDMNADDFLGEIFSRLCIGK